MKHIVFCVALLLCTIMCRGCAWAEDNQTASAATSQQITSAIDEAQRKADEDAKKAREEAALKEAEVMDQQGTLQATLERLEAEKKALDEKLDTAKKLYEQNEQETALLQKRSEEQKGQADEIAGSLRGIAQDLGTSISQSLVSGETPGRRKILEPLVTQNEFPSFEAIGGMADLMFEEMSRNGKISTTAMAFTDDAGRETRGDVVRIGMFNALWKKDGKVGYLEYSPAKETFSQFSVKMPGAYLGEAKQFTAGASQGLYLDPSSGGAFRFISDMPDWWEELKSGGSLMWPICLCGVIAVILAIERFITLMRHSKATAQLADAVTPVLQRGDWDAALRISKGSSIGLARVLAAGINHRQEQTEVLESVMEESIQSIRGPLDRNMASLQIIAVVSPLLGLLGTVTGMISTFNMLTIYGSGDPRLMSGGISEALVTTEYGLFISIPVILVHGYFQGKVGDIIGRIEEKAMTLVNSVKKIKRQAA